MFYADICFFVHSVFSVDHFFRLNSADERKFPLQVFYLSAIELTLVSTPD